MKKDGNVITLPTAKKQKELFQIAAKRRLESDKKQNCCGTGDSQKTDYEILISSWEFPASILDQ